MDIIPFNLENKEKQNQVLDIMKGFFIDSDNVSRLRQVFENELENGLRDGLNSSSLQMENTHVSELTNGKEQGSFLALDLGGTNFRVMLLDIEKGKIVNEKVSYYTMDESTRLGPGTELFDFLAECVMDFIRVHRLDDYGDVLPLGFTFSFPMIQRGLGILYIRITLVYFTNS